MAKITKHHSLVAADKVITVLKKMIAARLLGIDLSVWSNCREQGYFLRREDMDVAVVVAESRNSDRILVCRGAANEFDVQTHQPTEEAWKIGVEYFDTPEQAAKCIYRFFYKS